jgi:phosphoesterase RecJ-like protein
MGSQIGLKNILKENYPAKQIFAVGDSSDYLSYLEDSRMDDIPDSAYSGALAVILDCGAPALVSDTRYTLADATLRIDHHLFGCKFADTEFVDSTFESCCGMIAYFAREKGLRLNTLAAKSLFVGLVSDSGRLRYDCTTSRTFELASFLMQTPFDLNEIYINMYTDTFESKLLKAKYVLKIGFTPGNVAYIHTTKDELMESGADLFTISRGMVSTMSDIEGVSIWANFTESDNGILCELRSNRYNINPIAVKYGGGGHAKASGATLPDWATVDAVLGDLDKLTGEQI